MQTKGPFEICPNHNGNLQPFCDVEKEGELIARFYARDVATAEANARKFVQAGERLEALESMEAEWTLLHSRYCNETYYEDEPTEAVRLARAVIAKAKGE